MSDAAPHTKTLDFKSPEETGPLLSIGYGNRPWADLSPSVTSTATGVVSDQQEVIKRVTGGQRSLFGNDFQSIGRYSTPSLLPSAG